MASGAWTLARGECLLHQSPCHHQVLLPKIDPRSVQGLALSAPGDAWQGPEESVVYPLRKVMGQTHPTPSPLTRPHFPLQDSPPPHHHHSTLLTHRTGQSPQHPSLNTTTMASGGMAELRAAEQKAAQIVQEARAGKETLGGRDKGLAALSFVCRFPCVQARRDHERTRQHG